MKAFATSTLILMLLSLAQPAMASKARLTALGQNTDGSLFIKDERSIFLNPATINSSANSVNYEWGGTPSTAALKAEGGLVYKTSGFNYGFQMGRVIEATKAMNDDVAVKLAQNSFDVIFGNDAGLNWGMLIHYASFGDDAKTTNGFPDDEARTVNITAGAEMGMYSGYASVDLIHESTTDQSASTKQEYKGNLSIELGGTLKLSDDSKIGVQVESRGYDYDDGAGGKGTEEATRIAALYYKELPAKESVLLFYTAGLANTSSKDKPDGAGSSDDEVTNLYVPVTIGVETKAKDWLSLRASVSQTIFLDKEEKKHDGTDDYERNNEDNTVVAAGMSFHFEDFRIDGTFSGANTGSGNLDADELLNQVSMTYNF